MKNTSETISFDDMLDALSNIHRRKLLISLLEHDAQGDGPVIIGDSKSEIDDGKRSVTMRHVHLPKLVDYGFIIWNEETNEVMKGPEFDKIRPLIEFLKYNEEELPGDW